MQLACYWDRKRLIHSSMHKVYDNILKRKIQQNTHIHTLEHMFLTWCSTVLEAKPQSEIHNCRHTVWLVQYIWTYDTIPTNQCDFQPCNPLGILNGTFCRVLFLFSDRRLLRTLPQKGNNGKERWNCFNTIRSEAKQENINISCVTLSEPVHGVQGVVSVCVQHMWKASSEGKSISQYQQGKDLLWLTLYPIISTPPPALPLPPLSYGFHYSGMRVRGWEKPALHTCSAEWRHSTLKIFNMAKKHELGKHS